MIRRVKTKELLLIDDIFMFIFIDFFKLFQTVGCSNERPGLMQNGVYDRIFKYPKYATIKKCFLLITSNIFELDT